MYDKKYLYKLTFPNGKAYFGATRDITQRWANNGQHYRHQQVYKYIQKYGWDNIKKKFCMRVTVVILVIGGCLERKKR